MNKMTFFIDGFTYMYMYMNQFSVHVHVCVRVQAHASNKQNFRFVTYCAYIDVRVLLSTWRLLIKGLDPTTNNINANILPRISLIDMGEVVNAHTLTDNEKTGQSKVLQL